VCKKKREYKTKWNCKNRFYMYFLRGGRERSGGEKKAKEE
jgi:hypothetical protein